MAHANRKDILSLFELKISPVMLTIILAVLMWLMARVTEGYSIAPALRFGAMFSLFTAGTALAVAGILEFRKARTTVNPWRPHASSELVINGIYRWTRNPMYLALQLALVGWGLGLANLYSLLLGFVFVPYMNRFQIQPEENALTRTYGREFRDYCLRVRRWL